MVHHKVAVLNSVPGEKVKQHVLKIFRYKIDMLLEGPFFVCRRFMVTVILSEVIKQFLLIM